MRHIGLYDPARTPSIAALVNACVAARRNQLLPLVPELEGAGDQFLATRPQLHTLDPHPLAPPDGAALVSAYDGRTAEIKRRLAAMLATLPAAHNDLCPFCNLDSGAELDHFLPKVIYPEFALFGHNLLPICARCNKSKGNAIVDDDGERLFLFLPIDLVDDTRVLRADIRFEGAPHVRYYIDDEGALTANDLALVQRHFDRLKLASRFSRRAHSHLAGIQRTLSAKSELMINRVITASLLAAQAGEPTNSWQRALYDTMSGEIEAVLAWLA